MVIQTRNNNATKNKEWDCMYSKDSSHFHLNAHANIMSKTKKLTEWCCYSPAIDGFEFVIGDGDEQSGEKGRMRELITVQSIEGVGGYTIYSFDFSSYKQHKSITMYCTTYNVPNKTIHNSFTTETIFTWCCPPSTDSTSNCNMYWILKAKQKRMKI